MSNIFLKLVNMSISAGWIVLAVIILRFALKKAPKWVNVTLWGIVALRLLLPISIDSGLSLIPSAETIPIDIAMQNAPAINSGIPFLNSTINPIITQSSTPILGASVNPLQITIPILAAIWVLGILAMLIYTLVSYLKLKRKIDTAVLLHDNIYQSENVASPFVLGIIRPKIYIPFTLDEQTQNHVIAHEESHIRRHDHWWKPLGFLLLTIYWFNPILWIAYILLCRDIESACDERVIHDLGNQQRADYSQALLSFGISRRNIAACPLAFGEVGVKERVKNVLNYKKPTFWIIIVAVIACIAVAICFLTNPKTLPFKLDNLQLSEATTFDMRPDEPISFMLNTAELDELESRLKNLKIGKTIEDMSGLTPLYSLSIESDTYYFSIQGFDTEGKNIALRYEDEYYRINDSEFSKYLQNICAGGARTSATALLTLDDVITLSQKGDKLTWSDFAAYNGTEIGSGLYIMRYAINEQFCLLVGGTPHEAPLYIRLCADFGTDIEGYIDIRTENVESFIARHKYGYSTSNPFNVYSSGRCIYMTPLSSYLPDGDSLYRYYIGDDSFIIKSSVTGQQIASFDDISWNYKIFTQSDWKAWFSDFDYSVPDISGYKTTAYLDLDDKYRLLLMDNELWLMEHHQDNNNNDIVWNIYSLVLGERGLSENDPLNDAIRSAVLTHNNGKYSNGEFSCESHVVLGKEFGDGTNNKNTVTVYSIVLYEEFNRSGNSFEMVGGGHMPVALTFDMNDSMEYTLKEYWEPSDGDDNTSDIASKFPEYLVRIALDASDYSLVQSQACYAQAVAHWNIDTDNVIQQLFDSICTVPFDVFDRDDYMSKHSFEYSDLLNYGDYTLRYIFKEFLKGGQTDERGKYMRMVMDELIGNEALSIGTEIGQEYFDAWCEHIKDILESFDESYLSERYPKGWLLMQVINE